MPTSTSGIQQTIIATANNYGVPPSLALAVAQHESSFNPDAVSPQNPNGTVDLGVFQLNSSNLPAWGLSASDALDPAKNIEAGVSFLAQLLQQYGGDVAKALMAYNGGPGAAASGSTAGYANTVLGIQSTYAGADSAGSPDATDASPDTSGGAPDTSGGIPWVLVVLAGAVGVAFYISEG